MGTHALVVFEENTSQGPVRYIVVYFQFDGYLKGVGKELVSFLRSCVIVNGVSSRDEEKCEKENKILCNGFGCLVAQYVAKHKTGPLHFYVMPFTSKLEQEYNYIVTYDEKSKDQITISVNDSKKMSLEEFEKCCG